MHEQCVGSFGKMAAPRLALQSLLNPFQYLPILADNAIPPTKLLYEKFLAEQDALGGDWFRNARLINKSQSAVHKAQSGESFLSLLGLWDTRAVRAEGRLLRGYTLLFASEKAEKSMAEHVKFCGGRVPLDINGAVLLIRMGPWDHFLYTN